jgi:hypothetical protein
VWRIDIDLARNFLCIVAIGLTYAIVQMRFVECGPCRRSILTKNPNIGRCFGVLGYFGFRRRWVRAPLSTPVVPHQAALAELAAKFPCGAPPLQNHQTPVRAGVFFYLRSRSGRGWCPSVNVERTHVGCRFYV